MHTLHDPTDLNHAIPDVALQLDAVGVTGVVRGIVLAGGLPATATIDVDVQLGPERRGAHMSRFHEAIESALALVGSEGNDVRGLDLLATVIAARAAELQECTVARARVRAALAWPRVTPASSRRSIDPFDAWGAAHVDLAAPSGTTLLGASATGMTACPCAQGLVAASARARMLEDGMTAANADRVLELLPVATHNQRGTGSVELRVPNDGSMRALVDPTVLADLVRSSMSAATHELLKRSDELAIVEHAHASPRFVEDCLRELGRLVATAPELADLPPETVVYGRQVNHESIHAHDVEASTTTTLATLRALAVAP